MSAIELTDVQLEQLADMVADRLARVGFAAGRPAATNSFITAEELAELLSVDVKTVYRRADALGAVRVGRAVRFDPAKALAAWAGTSASHVTHSPVVTKPHKRTRAPKPDGLLPVGRRS